MRLRASCRVVRCRGGMVELGELKYSQKIEGTSFAVTGMVATSVDDTDYISTLSLCSAVNKNDEALYFISHPTSVTPISRKTASSQLKRRDRSQPVLLCSLHAPSHPRKPLLLL